MKKYIITFLVLILSFSFNLFSQNNGFLGKRVLFNMDVKITPVFSSPTYFGSYDFMSADFTISPNLECIVYNKGIVGLAFNYLSTRYQYGANLPVNFYGAGLFYKQYLSKSDDYYQAPFGVYALLRFDYFKYYAINPNALEYSNTIFGARAEIGVDYLLWNRVRLSWGLSFGLTNKGVISDFDIWSSYTDSFETAVEDRFAKNYFYQNKIGIGILLF